MNAQEILRHGMCQTEYISFIMDVLMFKNKYFELKLQFNLQE